MSINQLRRLLAASIIVCFSPISFGQASPEASPTPNAQSPGNMKIADMSIDQLMQAADMARQKGRFSDAIQLMNIVIQREGGQQNIEVMRLLGEIAYDMGNAEEAKKNWLAVRKIQPSDFGANWGLGRLNLRSGQFRSATYYLEAAEQVMPSDKSELKPELLVNMAQAYNGAGLRSQAIEKAEEAIRIEPEKLDAWFVMTSLRTELAQTPEAFDRAMGDANRLVEIAEKDAKTKGLSRETVQMLQYAYSQKLNVLYAYRNILFEKNVDGSVSDEPVPGREDLIAETMNNAVDVMLRQADLERLMKHFTIVDLARDVTKFDGGTDPGSLLKLGALLTATGQYAEAESTLLQVLALDPDNEAAHRQLDAVQSQLPVTGSSK